MSFAGSIQNHMHFIQSEEGQVRPGRANKVVSLGSLILCSCFGVFFYAKFFKGLNNEGNIIMKKSN